MTLLWRQTTVLIAVVIVLWGGVLAGGASAAPLPKGTCTDPKPYTDLRHCSFREADLRNKDLRGTDLRGTEPYRAELQGANLTGALVDGREITHAYLEGVTGLPPEALKILKTKYLVTKQTGGELVLSVQPSEYQGDYLDIAGLDDIHLAYKVPGTSSTIVILSYPHDGDAPSPIFARFEQGKFGFPACYRGLGPTKEGEHSYYGKWDSLQVRPLKTGGFLIGARARGWDSDGNGASGSSTVELFTLSPTCRMIKVYHGYLDRGGNSKDIEINGQYPVEWCGGELDYRLLDDHTAEIITTIPVSSKEICGAKANPREQVLRKKISVTEHP